MDYLENRLIFEDDLYGGIEVLFCGKRENTLNYRREPITRDYYLFVYIINGTGKLYLKNKTLNLKSGDMFVNNLNEEYSFHADENERWDIRWLAVRGNTVEEFLCKFFKNTNVIHLDNGIAMTECFNQIFYLMDSDDVADKYTCISRVYDFLSLLYKSSSLGENGSNYVTEAKIFMKKNFAEKITVKDVADHLKINASYFSRLFTKEMGVSPIKYLSTVRIQKAAELLTTTNMSIEDISYSVGIDDALYFSRFFKKVTGSSPMQFKKINKF